MATIEVSATANKGAENEHTETVHFELGDTVSAITKQFGEEVCYNQLKSQLVVSLQGFMRSKMNGKEQLRGKKLQEAVNSWKPGIRTPGKPASEKVKDLFAKLSPEEKKALMRDLRG